MSKSSIINLRCFNTEIGKLGFDENKSTSYFQFNPDFLNSGLYSNMFPFVFKRIEQTQVFNHFNSETFRSLPPMIADSLPDMFGNLIFKTWLENKGLEKISILEQLTYVANRGMGALEFEPATHLPKNTSINLDDIILVLQQVVHQKDNIIAEGLDSKALVNIFKMGSSAGGAQPKLLISENKKSGKIMPGDLEFSDLYNHYLVKLHLDDDKYNRCLIEYSYYLTANFLGINMMPSKLIDNKHFATYRFDRQNGRKQHTLTATGITGWDFRNPDVSSYENLFSLANYLNLSDHQINELYRRMVFNIVFANADDHLKNHAFIYDEKNNQWQLSPAYDITYSLNPILNYKKSSRALSINNKRVDILLEDILKIAQTNTIKNPQSIIDETINAIAFWEEQALIVDIPKNIISNIKRDFRILKS